MVVGKVDAEIMPGKRSLIGRRQVPLVQLQALRASHQRQQQALTVVAQPGFEVALQTHFEQPQT
ncbi:hypothetical protein D3C72_2385580 [compost metagenome]